MYKNLGKENSERETASIKAQVGIMFEAFKEWARSLDELFFYTMRLCYPH